MKDEEWKDTVESDRSFRSRIRPGDPSPKKDSRTDVFREIRPPAGMRRVEKTASRRTRPCEFDREIERAAEIVRNGGVVAFPTETVYGLGANAYDAGAVARIFEVKRRPRFDPLIVHITSVAEARSVVADFPETARKLTDRFWPGPLTLVLTKGDRIPGIVTAGLQTVAVRMPDHPVALDLIHRAGVGVAAPSANVFGSVSPTTAEHVRRQLGNRIDMVLDGGPCRVGIESTIVSLVDGPPALLRPGGTAVEDIERVIGPLLRPASNPDRPVAPGQLPRHYAPRTPLLLREGAGPPSGTARTGLLALRPPATRDGFAAVEVLSADGDLREAAANLFAALHRLDAQHLDLIFAEQVPETGLGTAINDRLRRAAHGPAEADPLRSAE